MEGTVKIYTKKGDGGMTGLATGERVPKHDLRVEMYGTADELNAVLGLVCAHLAGDDSGENHRQLLRELQEQQCLLFELGAELAGYYRNAGESVMEESDVRALEEAIDRMSERLEPMRAFILPGGTTTASFLHLARTVCRRLERQMTAAREERPDLVLTGALKYINRLSDYLFVAARYANHLAGTTDIPWKSRKKGG
jgi:cob(I)alamin adenosyltransferase